MPTPLDNEIATSLRSLGPEAAVGTKFNAQHYIAAFKNSAQEKAKSVLDLLHEESRFVTARPFFVSIGGGDGEEVAYLLEHSGGTAGILIELLDSLAQVARERNVPAGKSLTVLAKPAQDAIEEAIRIAVDSCRRGESDAIVVTCHAVLHELYDRGGGHFDEIVFFSKIFAAPEIPVWFTYREPGPPDNWPDTVLISADCAAQSLLELAKAIILRHPDIKNVPTPIIVGDRLRVSKHVAVELLTKLFYLGDLPHEMEERTTAVDHRRLQNAMFVAMGDRDRFEGRVSVRTAHAPTKSFVKKWEELKVRADGLSEQNTLQPLAIAESQVRVVGWRVPPEPQAPPATVSTMPTDIALAQDALRQSDESLLSSILTSRGRSWIESSYRDAGLDLLENVRRSAPAASFLSFWSRYLLSIAGLFSGGGREQDLFARADDAENVGLGKLWRGEQMETLRKGGDLDGALIIAHTLTDDLAKENAARSDLESYATGTASFLIGNFLRSGGRYDDAMKFIQRAERTFKPTIESHVTELAHCFYAKQVCVAMTGAMTFSEPYRIRSENTERFAGALIELSYSHAAWFLGDIARAAQHSQRAAERFDFAATTKYPQRARNLHALLTVWSDLTSGRMPNYEALDPRYGRGVKAMMTGDDSEYLKSWFSGLRPSTAVGLLQIPEKFSTYFNQTVKVSLPKTLESFESGTRWKWRATETVTTLRDAALALRQNLAIPSTRIVPLIAD